MSGVSGGAGAGLYQLTYNISCQSQYGTVGASCVSLPVTLVSHTNQESKATASLLWNYCNFADTVQVNDHSEEGSRNISTIVGMINDYMVNELNLSPLAERGNTPSELTRYLMTGTSYKLIVG